MNRALLSLQASPLACVPMSQSFMNRTGKLPWTAFNTSDRFLFFFFFSVWLIAANGELIEKFHQIFPITVDSGTSTKTWVLNELVHPEFSPEQVWWALTPPHGLFCYSAVLPQASLPPVQTSATDSRFLSFILAPKLWSISQKRTFKPFIISYHMIFCSKPSNGVSSHLEKFSVE